MDKAAARVREMHGRVEGLEAELSLVRGTADTDANSRVEAMQQRVSSVQCMLAATRADKERAVAELQTKVKVCVGGVWGTGPFGGGANAQTSAAYV
jgi:hypothetical protein